VLHSNDMSVPLKAQVLVIGGGPAGSYAASVLAKEGLDVVLLEASQFPRYHIGESLLPSIRYFLQYIGLLEEFADHGFCVKPGAAVRFSKRKQEAYTDFIGLGLAHGSWNVVRSEADELLLRQAGKLGAKIVEETKVNSLVFEGDPATTRPTAAKWTNVNGQSGTIEFDYLVDASGRRGIMSTTYLKNRKFNEGLRNIAFWGYWKGAGKYKPGSNRENAPYFESLEDESGWAWFIPLHDGSVSVGVVLHQDIFNRKYKELKSNVDGASLETLYHSTLDQYAPDIKGLLGNGELQRHEDGVAIKQASDFSYNAPRHAGPRYRVAGDAGAFIDPFFSSGVHLAVSGGMSAAATICAEIRGHCTPEEAENWHSSKIGASYVRFQLAVMAAYKQIHNLDAAILSDVDEDNFDKAFDLFRPVIQGSADFGRALTQGELNEAVQFCTNIFGDIVPEGVADEAANLKEQQTRKVIMEEYAEGLRMFGSDPINGMVVDLKAGKLGLIKA